MKKLKYTVLLITTLIISCEYHPSRQPHDHLIVTIGGAQTSERFYVVGDYKLEGSCISFTCIDNWDFEGHVNKTICGTFKIEY